MLVLLDEADCPVARPVRLWDRLLARLRASRLDRDLADGASPDATVALALRAQRLVRPRTRRDVARGAQRVPAAATQAPAAHPTPAPAAGPRKGATWRDRVRHTPDSDRVRF